MVYIGQQDVENRAFALAKKLYLKQDVSSDADARNKTIMSLAQRRLADWQSNPERAQIQIFGYKSGRNVAGSSIRNPETGKEISEDTKYYVNPDTGVSTYVVGTQAPPKGFTVEADKNIHNLPQQQKQSLAQQAVRESKASQKVNEDLSKPYLSEGALYAKTHSVKPDSKLKVINNSGLEDPYRQQSYRATPAQIKAIQGGYAAQKERGIILGKPKELIKKESMFTGGTGLVSKSEYKPGYFEQMRYNYENQKPTTETFFQTAKRITTGSALLVSSYYGGKAIGFLKGFIAPFRPKFYTEEVPATARAIYGGTKHFFKGGTFPEVGEALYQRPITSSEKIGEFQGYGAGMGIAFRVMSRVKGEAITRVKPPGYVPTGAKEIIDIVPEVTKPQSTVQLLKLESQTVPTVHATLSPQLKYGTVLKAVPEAAGGLRKDIGQFNFYQSAPSILMIGNKEYYQANIYGGYIGLGQKSSPYDDKTFSLLPQQPKAFIFQQQISPTPESVIKKGILETVKYQSEKAGTYIPAENLFGLSKEGQVTTSVGTSETPIFELAKPKNTVPMYTYYKEVPEAPERLKKSNLLSKAYSFVGTQYKKIKLYPAELKQWKPEQYELVKTKKATPEQEIKYNKDISQKFKKAFTSKSISESSKPSYSVVDAFKEYFKRTPSSSKKSSSSISKSVSQQSSSLSESLSKSDLVSSKPTSSSEKIKSSLLSNLSKSSPSKYKSSYSYSSSKSISSPPTYTSTSSSSISRESTPYYPSNYKRIPTSYKRSDKPKLEEGYNVFIKRAGKFKSVAFNLPKQRALQIGLKQTLSNLGATFKLERTGKSAIIPDIKQDVERTSLFQKAFRNFKISGGKKIELDNIFIQKTTQEGGLKGGRLSNPFEVLEIQKYKKRRKNKQ